MELTNIILALMALIQIINAFAFHHNPTPDCPGGLHCNPPHHDGGDKCPKPQPDCPPPHCPDCPPIPCPSPNPGDQDGTSGPHLPIFNLGDPVKFPDDLLNPIIDLAAAGCPVSRTESHDGFVVVDANHRRIASYNRTSGEVNVTPLISKLRPGQVTSFADAACLLGDAHLFPADGTVLSPSRGSDMRGTFHRRNQTGRVNSRLYLSTVHAKRYIEYGNERIPVCGPGTRALFRIATDNKVHSLHYRWRKAQRTTKGVPLLKSSGVNQTISKHLTTSAGKAIYTA